MTTTPDDRFANPETIPYSDDSTESCDLCGAQPATSREFMYVMSFLFFTRHSKYSAVLCRTCSTRNALKEHVKSSVLGWWGIPWGLMTFQAIWINTSTLLRWSRLATAGALVVGLLGLTIPAAVGYVIYRASQKERVARSTGDWVDDEVIELMGRGNDSIDNQELETALYLYKRALERAPRSSAVSFAVATTLYYLGRLDEALPYEAKAESTNPDSVSHRAVHGLLLSYLGRTEEVAERVAMLADATPQDVEEAYWMAELFYQVEDYAQLERVASVGQQIVPGNEYYRTARLSALLWLDRVEEAGEIVETLDPESVVGSDLDYLSQAYRMRISPNDEISRVLAAWSEDEYGVEFMAMLAEFARRAGESDAVQSRVEDWLLEEATAPSSWFIARPWFSEEQWIPSLDRHLAKRPTVVPALLRIQELDVIADADDIFRIASNARQTEDPMMPFLDALYFDSMARTQSHRATMRAREEHSRERPEHVLCLYRLARHRAQQDLAAGRALLDRVEQAAADDPGLLADIELVRLELDLADGDPSETLVALIRQSAADETLYRPREYLDLMIAEAAFHTGDLETMNQSIERVLSGAAPEIRAPALLIRWCSQWIAGQTSTYREDVAVLLGDDDSELRHSESPSAQGVLLAEGRVDREWVRRATLDRPGETPALIDIIRKAATGEQVSDDTLESIARSDAEGSFARRLARTILASRTASAG